MKLTELDFERHGMLVLVGFNNYDDVRGVDKMGFGSGKCPYLVNSSADIVNGTRCEGVGLVAARGGSRNKV